MKNAVSLSLISIVLFAVQACERKTADKENKEQVNQEAVLKREGEPDYVKAFDEDRMGAAIAEAKSNLTEFTAALEKNASTTESFTIKKAYTHGEGGKEFIWIGKVKLVDGVFQGEIGNEPVNAIGVALGEKVKVEPEEVEDWMYMSEGRLKGGYTIVALVYGTAEQALYEEKMGIDWKSYKFLKIEK